MRGVILIIDAFGIGSAPDAGDYNDTGAHTLRSAAEARGSGGQVQWPTLLALGLGNSATLTGPPVAGCPPVEHPEASYGVMAPASRGKDTTTGHWEIAGIIMQQGFHLFPPDYPSFPPELVARFERETGFTLIGNRAVSGTAIIEELGEVHLQGGGLICYTSADSVFQIAAHEEVVPLAQLYQTCLIARRICDDYGIARVIARPFTGEPGNFTRTAGRHDYSIDLPGPSMLDMLRGRGVETVGIGKIGDIFNQQGLAVSHPDKGNGNCLRRLQQLLEEGGSAPQLIFVNLVDTDMLYGHRRDAEGYYRAIEEIDIELEGLLSRLADDDFLIISADHGCDPKFRGTDHTREYVPLLFYQRSRKPAGLGIRASFADLAATVCSLYGVEGVFGTPFLSA